MYCRRDIADWLICASLIQLPELEVKDVKYKQEIEYETDRIRCDIMLNIVKFWWQF